MRVYDVCFWALIIICICKGVGLMVIGATYGPLIPPPLSCLVVQYTWAITHAQSYLK